MVDHADDAAVMGRAFNVADEAPLPLAEHLEAALTAVGYQPGRILPTWPRLTGALLWLVRHVPDRVLLASIDARLARRWAALAQRAGVAGTLTPRVDREALHWMAADHYYDTGHLAALGWRALHPVATAAYPETIRALVAGSSARLGRTSPARLVDGAESPEGGRQSDQDVARCQAAAMS